MDINKLWSGYDLNSKKQNSRCLSVNTILEGKYLVGPVLGQGGFGITYVGYDLNMEAKIAIKEYFPVELVSRDTTTMHGDRVLSLSGEKSVTYQQGLKKYVAEAQNVSQFSEVPGVVSVKDFFYANETAYIVMEFIDGINLKDYLKEQGGRLSEEETLKIMKPVLEALVQVHKAGIIHRDISPDNIMLTFEDDNNIKDVKLIDFGAARMTAKNDQKSLTIILKHGYAPEEQYRTHGEQGPWTDVYAICATMYRMVTGETPVPAMDRLFQDELKKPSDMGVKLNASTEAAILKGLAVKKDDRIKTMQELIGALYEGKKVSVPGSADRSAKRNVMIAAVCAAGILLAVGGISGFLHNRSAENDLNSAAQEEPGMESVAEEKSSVGASDGTIAGKAEEVALSLEEKQELGETIVAPDPQTAISGEQQYHILIRLPDGSVKAMGPNEYGQCMVADWSDIAAVSASRFHSLGLRSDGKVFATGKNDFGQCAVETWTDVVQIAAGTDTSYGLTGEGTVLAAGWNEDGHFEKISEWSNIAAIVSDGANGLIGVDTEGNIHYEGDEQDWPVVSGWEGVKHLAYRSSSLLGIKEDGTVLKAQLDESEWLYEGVENWTDMQQISANLPVLGVNKAGTAVAQKDANAALQEELSGWKDLEAVSSICMSDRLYVVGLTKDGSVLEYTQSFGNSEPESMENLAWINPMETSGYTNLVAGTRDGRLLSYGLENFRMDDLAGLNRRNDFPVSLVTGIAGIDALQLADGRVFYIGHFSNGNENACIGEHVKQAVELWRGAYGKGMTYGYAFLTEEGRVQIRTLGDLSTSSEYLERVRESEDWTDVVQIAGKRGELFGLHSDGTISSTGKEVKAEGIIRMAFRDGELLGIREDGTAKPLLASDYAVAFGRTQVESWDNLQDISMGESHVAGLRTDGTVVAAGSNHAGQCDVEDWTDIVYLTAGKNCTLGITKDGTLKIAGSLY